MKKCEDCDEPVLFLRKPGGGWFPPVQPILDFAYGDHFIATIDGTGQTMPVVYKLHQCLTWEEKQLKNFHREQEKAELQRIDRERRAEAARRQLEFEQEQDQQRIAMEAAEAAQRELDRQEKERKLEAARAKRFEKEVARHRIIVANKLPTARLKVIACKTCHAEVGEACRDPQYFGNADASPWLWWRSTPCNYRFQVGPADDRSRISMPGRWSEDYDEATGQGTTPMTVGPWPPSRTDAGRYDMRNWLRNNFLYVFEPEKIWLTSEEEANLTHWLADFGDLFQPEESRQT